MITVRRYIAGDAALITPRAVFRGEEAVTRALVEGRMVPEGRAWTVCEGLDPIACGGIAPIWAGRWQGWGWVGELNRRQWLTLTVIVRQLVAAALAAPDVRRIEAHTPHAFLPGVRWLKKLGFRFECVAPRFGPNGETYTLMSATR